MGFLWGVARSQVKGHILGGELVPVLKIENFTNHCLRHFLVPVVSLLRTPPVK